MRRQAQGAPNHLGSFGRITGALEKTGRHQVFTGRLGFVTESFVNDGQILACCDEFRVDLRDVAPIFKRLVRILNPDI